MSTKAERTIHISSFVLLLVGLCGFSAWASMTYVMSNEILKFAAIALSWGVILLVLYVIFRALRWDWWS